MNTKRIAITGIDGSGKSTIIQQLIQQSVQVDSRFQAFSCTNYHDTPNAPFAALSKAFDQLSQFADEKNDGRIKYAALYLKMSLFGPIEQFFLQHFRPQFLFTERQALVASLVYGSFYAQINNTASKEKTSNSLWGPQLINHAEIPWETILQWFELENQRLNRPLDFWDLPTYLLGLMKQTPQQLLQALAVLFRTQLPEKIIYLQIDPALAARRVGQQKTKEIHESEQNLIRLHQQYQKVLQLMEKMGVQIIQLPVDEQSPEQISRQILQTL